MKLPKVLAAILCEDIRQEMTGKFSLAGAYASDLMNSNLTAPFPCGVFAEIISEEAGELHVEFRVTDGGGKICIAGRSQTFFTEAGKQPFILGPFQLTASEYGAIRFEWRLHGQKHARWVTIKSFELRSMPQAIPAQIPDAVKELLSKILGPKPGIESKNQ